MVLLLARSPACFREADYFTLLLTHRKSISQYFSDLEILSNR